MADVWVVDSNCFIHVGSMAPNGFLDDLKKILASNSSGLYVTPGVHGEIKTVRFQRWKGQPNLLDEFRDILITVTVEEAEVIVARQAKDIFRLQRKLVMLHIGQTPPTM